MTFKVTVLGTSSANPTKNRHHSAHAVNVHEQYYLIDCGEGTQSQLLRVGINPLKINAVFITHLHGDHIFGLFPLISTMGLGGRRTPLTIFAPAPFGEIMENHFRYFDKALPFELIYKEVDTRKNMMVYETKVMEVWTIPLRHRISATGYLIREKTPPLNIFKHQIERYGLSIAQIAAAKRGENIYDTDGNSITNSEITYTPYAPRSYAYCSDTLYSGKAVSLVKEVDLLYHEATFAHTDKDLAKTTGHTTARQAGLAAQRANAGRLLIGHFSSRYKDLTPLLEEARQEFPATELAEELTTYEIPIRKSTAPREKQG